MAMALAILCCPICEQRIGGHLYQRLASIPIRGDNTRDVAAFLGSVRNHKWEELSKFQDWEGGLDDLDAYLFKCLDGRYYIAVIYAPVALEGNDELFRHELVREGDLPLLTGPWKRL